MFDRASAGARRPLPRPLSSPRRTSRAARALTATLPLLLVAPAWAQEAGSPEAETQEEGAPAAPQEGAAPSVDVGPPPTVADTGSMDPALATFLAERVAAVEAAPSDVEARRDLALAYEANSIWTLAEVAYTQALELVPDDMQWRFRRGVVRYCIGDLEGALEDARAAAETYKNTPVVQARRGDIARMMGELDEAEAAWRQAIAAEANQPQNIQYPQSRVGLAQTLLDLDEPEEANALCEQALAVAPSYRHAHFIRGRALRDLGRMDEAEVALALGADSFPGFPPDPHQQRLNDAMRGFSRRMMMIENLVEMGQVGEAQARLAEMLTERPDDHMVQNLAARVALRTGDPARAQELLEASLAAHPDEPSTLVEACLLELELANQSLAQMSQLQMQASQGMQVEPAQIEALRAQGAPHAEKALEYGRRAAELAPYVGRNRFWFGMAQRTQAAFETDQQKAMQAMQGALQTLEMAGKLGCTEPSYHQQLTGLYYQSGQKPQALKHAKLHLARNPLDPAALQSVIQLCLENGRQEAISPYVARLQRVAIEAKNAALLQFVIQGFLTNQEYDAAEATLPAFEEATAGDPNGAAFVTSVRQFIATERAKTTSETPEGGNG